TSGGVSNMALGFWRPHCSSRCKNGAWRDIVSSILKAKGSNLDSPLTMRAESPVVRSPERFTTLSARPTIRTLGGVLVLSLAAVLIHGYHPFVEDAEIYVPGIKKLLNPALYPLNDGFFAAHARLTLFPNLIGWSARTTHLPLEWV